MWCSEYSGSVNLPDFDRPALPDGEYFEKNGISMI